MKFSCIVYIPLAIISLGFDNAAMKFLATMAILKMTKHALFHSVSAVTIFITLHSEYLEYTFSKQNSIFLSIEASFRTKILQNTNLFGHYTVYTR